MAFWTALSDSSSVCIFSALWLSEGMSAQLQVHKNYKVTANECSICTDLASGQEEADTCLLLHAAHPGKRGYQSVVIVSDNPDVFFTSLAFNDDSTLSGCEVRNSSWSWIRQPLLKSISPWRDTWGAILGFHWMTRCDNTGAFTGRG